MIALRDSVAVIQRAVAVASAETRKRQRVTTDSALQKQRKRVARAQKTLHTAVHTEGSAVQKMQTLLKQVAPRITPDGLRPHAVDTTAGTLLLGPALHPTQHRQLESLRRLRSRAAYDTAKATTAYEAERATLTSRHSAASVLGEDDSIPCSRRNAPGFDAEAVARLEVYTPPHDRNVLFLNCPAFQDVFREHAALPDRPPFTPQQWLHGFDGAAAAAYVGILVVTRTCKSGPLAATSHYTASDLAAAGMSDLLPGKKYVTWYIGGYASESTQLEPHRRAAWNDMAEWSIRVLERCPDALNSRAVLAGAGASDICVTPDRRPLPNAAAWNTATMEWVINTVDVWARRLHTYAPYGFNTPLNHAYHSALIDAHIPRGLRPYPWAFAHATDGAAHAAEAQSLWSGLQKDIAATLRACAHTIAAVEAQKFHLVPHVWPLLAERLRAAAALTPTARAAAHTALNYVDILQHRARTLPGRAEALRLMEGEESASEVEGETDFVHALLRTTNDARAVLQRVLDVCEASADETGALQQMERTLRSPPTASLDSFSPSRIAQLATTAGVQHAQLATISEIRSAFKDVVLRHAHPDRGGSPAAFTAAMRDMAALDAAIAVQNALRPHKPALTAALATLTA